jgi:hypothetical protein
MTIVWSLLALVLSGMGEVLLALDDSNCAIEDCTWGEVALLGLPVLAAFLSALWASRSSGPLGIAGRVGIAAGAILPLMVSMWGASPDGFGPWILVAILAAVGFPVLLVFAWLGEQFGRRSA